ncbi:MAG: hypothetical protein AAF662_01460 [Pseudomonadota bacterium]
MGALAKVCSGFFVSILCLSAVGDDFLDTVDEIGQRAASGDQNAIVELVGLYPTDSAAVIEFMRTYLAIAMEKSPVAVLRVIGQHEYFGDCDFVSVTGEEFVDRFAEQRVLLLERREMLRQIEEPELANLRDRCIVKLDATIEALAGVL